MAFQLTPRDLKLMTWLDEHGYANSLQLARWLNVTTTTAYGRLSKLIQAGYLKHDFVLHGEHGVYSLTPLGLRTINSTRPHLRRIAPGLHRHSIRLITLSQDLLLTWPGHFIPERVLRHEARLPFNVKRPHLSDGHLIYQGHCIAIELELHKKNRTRRDHLFRSYLRNKAIDQVWYFCQDKQVLRQLEYYSQKAHWFKISLVDKPDTWPTLELGKAINSIEPIPYAY